MAFLPGHGSKVTCSLSDGSYGEITGINNADFGPLRELIEVTDFADTSGARKRLAGLKDLDLSLSGHYEVATGQDLLVAAWISGADVYMQFLPNGTAGFKSIFKIENFKVTAGVEGSVQVSFTCKGNGAITVV